MVAMLNQKAFKANRTQVIFAKGLDIFVFVDFALGQVLVTVGEHIATCCCTLAKSDIKLIVLIIGHLTRKYIFAVPIQHW